MEIGYLCVFPIEPLGIRRVHCCPSRSPCGDLCRSKTSPMRSSNEDLCCPQFGILSSVVTKLPDRSVREVAIIGSGMIGTSIALALRKQGILTYLCDRDPYAAAMAAARRGGVVGLPAAPVDIAVLAVPPSDIVAVLAECQAKSLAHFYTDVGSVKVAPTAEAERIGCDLTNYVGGHPMAGSARSGPLAASADLFRDRPWALTPLANTSPAAIDAVVELVVLAGAHPVMMTPSEHARAVARISHVPHLVASALAAAEPSDATARST
ncbi:prephenate dehydrogenase/arogenate dehydrogenase family protein [Nocardia pseudovaccinii]|uniref:prephenate dehydrogenase/arogenate dehydrogenase family protein n=1 Tax=Nocardia pseudovaccinii TaxID=189540 RepID=UPI003D8F7899